MILVALFFALHWFCTRRVKPFLVVNFYIHMCIEITQIITGGGGFLSVLTNYAN